MSKKLIARKLGMLKHFDESGNLVVCTALLVEPNVVTQIKTVENDGYQALQLGGNRCKESKKKNVSKPLQGHFASKKVEPHSKLFEVRVDSLEGYELGQQLDVTMFEDVGYVDITGKTSGKGYQGVMKRHGFKGGPSAHGSGFHRHAGSTGMRSTPGRTFPGLKMPGHMGAEKKTQEGLKVVKVLKDKSVLLVKGAVPGPKGTDVFIRQSLKKEINKKK